jgi:hypothetical protein
MARDEAIRRSSAPRLAGGFLGIPQLSLTAGIGLHANLASRGQSYDDPFAGDVTIRDNAFNFGTNVQGNPWAIFTNGISALYYF